MAKSPVDDADSLKRAARRRLVGAVAITIAVVILLPMLLDSEPDLSGQDIELRIPDKDQVGEFNPKLPAAAPPQVDVSDLSGVETPAAMQNNDVSTALGASAVSVSAPLAISAVSSVLAATASSQSAESNSPTVKPATEKKQPDKVASTKTGENKMPAPRQFPPTSGFIVQAGAFSNANSALELQKKLTGMGIKAYIEKVGDKTRVRAGPYTTHAAADKVRKKLEAQGLKPILSSSPTHSGN